jgi:hypothetical protein
VSEEILAELLRDGVVFKGGDKEEAVLCTQQATYAVKLVETSNSLLLVPPARARGSRSRSRMLTLACHAERRGAACRSAVRAAGCGGGKCA